MGVEQRSVVRTMRALAERVSSMHKRWEEVIVQRYIEQILAAILSQNAAIQASAMDILSFTVRQGLSHPMQAWRLPRCALSR